MVEERLEQHGDTQRARDEGLGWNSWILMRLVLPLVSAALVLQTRWGEDNVVLVIGLPIFFLLLGLAISSVDRPSHAVLEKSRAFTSLTTNWHIQDVLSLVCLMIFEGAVAGMAEMRNDAMGDYLKLLGAVYLPCALLAYRARIDLLLARGMIAAYEERFGWEAEFEIESAW